MTRPDTTDTIRRSATRFFTGTALSRVSGLMRDMAMAFAFGTEGAIASFMVSFRFAHLARRLFGEGSLQNTFIPHFEELRHENPKRGIQFFRDLNSSLVIILLILIVLSVGAISALLYNFDLGTTTHSILLLTCLMLPSLLFICLFGLNAALLECEKSYFLPSIAPVAFNFVWITAALAFMALPADTAVIYLALAVVVACFAQWAFTVPKTIRLIGGASLFSLAPFSPDVQRLVVPLFLANLGVAASQINNALDPLFAIFANAEGPAWLWYAIRIQQLPLALFGIALSGALLPPLSRAIKNGELARFQHFFSYALRKTQMLMLPIMACILATAPAAVNLLFGRGHFDDESVSGTSLCLLGYSLGLLPMTEILIAAPALYAFGDYKTPTRSALTAMAANAFLNVVFIFGLGLGAASVAFATSIAAFLNNWQLQSCIQKKTAIAKEPFNLRILWLSLGALLITCSVEWLAYGQVASLQTALGTPLNLSQVFTDQMLQLSLLGGVFVASFAGMAYCLGFEYLWNEKATETIPKANSN